MIFLLRGDPSSLPLFTDEYGETTFEYQRLLESGGGYGTPLNTICNPKGWGCGDWQRWMVPSRPVQNYSGMDDRCGESDIVPECGSRELDRYGDFDMYLPEGLG